MDAFRKIIKAEGVVGLYKGFLPSLAGVGVGQLYLATYEFTRRSVRQWNPDYDFAAPMAGGIAASCVAQTVGVPVDVVVQKLMVEKKEQSTVRTQFSRMFAIVKEIRVQSGIQGFFRGYWLQVVQFGPASGLWWTVYNRVCSQVGETNTTELTSGQWRVAVQSVGATMASIVSVYLTNPLDVVRTRIQVGGGTSTKMYALPTIRELIAEDGFRWVFRGVQARLFASVPSSVLMISYYEFVKILSRTDKPEDDSAHRQ